MTVDTRTYDDGGRMISSSYNNGVSQTRAYNSDNTLASITHAGAAIGSYTYNWDSNKNKTGEAISGVLSGFGFTVPASGYDGEDRLTAWNRSDNALSKAWNLSLVGDWNSVTENAQTQARTHGPTHELLSAAGQLIEHDVKGNTTKIPAILRTTDAANPQPDLNLSWGFDNRMRSASDGAVTVSYSFDALGRRVARTDSATTVVYVQNGQQTVADYVLGTAAASPTYTYTHASYIDEPVLRTGIGGDRYYHRNQQYSITALTDSTGAIQERYAYTAYGTPTTTDVAGVTRTTSTETNRYTYTGREWDETLSLYHYRTRMYDSVSGRFCSRDPIGYMDGPSTYQYVLGRPTIAVDYWGHSIIIIPFPMPDPDWEREDWEREDWEDWIEDGDFPEGHHPDDWPDDFPGPLPPGTPAEPILWGEEEGRGDDLWGQMPEAGGGDDKCKCTMPYRRFSRQRPKGTGGVYPRPGTGDVPCKKDEQVLMKYRGICTEDISEKQCPNTCINKSCANYVLYECKHRVNRRTGEVKRGWGNASKRGSQNSILTGCQ